MNTFSHGDFVTIPASVAAKIHNKQYLGADGAIASANRLTSAAYPWEEDTKLLIMGARMNAYYSAAGHYQARGVKYYPIALYFLYVAKCLADDFLFHFIGRKTLHNFEHVGIIQQCQATYAKWAIAKQRLKLSIKEERRKVFSLHENIHANRYATDQLKTLADAVAYEFLRINGAPRADRLHQSIVIAIDRLQKDTNRSQDDSQVLSRLLRSIGRHIEAEEVALQANLLD